MLLTIFLVLLGLLAVFLYFSLFKGDTLFTTFVLPLSFGLWGILNAQGIDIVSQIDATGTYIYVAKTVANDLGVTIMAWLLLVIGLISFINLISMLWTKKPLYRVGYS